jgi:hypothetical protein
VLLKDEQGSLRLTVSGYQFPHAADPVKRFSWHMLEGEATTSDGTWRFRYPALACTETPMVGMWLTTVADWLEESTGDFPPPRLDFTTSIVSFAVAEGAVAGGATLVISLDREFKPPWHRFEGSPAYVVEVRQDVPALRQAAVAWTRETAPYPDGLEQLADEAETD